MDYYIGQIMLWSADWAPQGWAKCEGQTLQVNENQALFSIIGNQFGGDGHRTFSLPDLRGRVPLGYGRGRDLSDHAFSSEGGAEYVALSIRQMPEHTHAIKAGDNPKKDKPLATLNALQGATTQLADPKDNMLGVDGVTLAAIYAQQGTGTKVAMHPDSISIEAPALYTNETTGANEAHVNMQPYLDLNYIIAVSGGEYPIRSYKRSI